MQITWEQMQPATLQERVLYKVVEHLKSGKLPDIKNLSSDLQPYFNKKLSLEDGDYVSCHVVVRTNTEIQF